MAWYVARDGQTWGPADFEQLKRAAATGSLLPSDLLSQGGMNDWKPASTITGLWPPDLSASSDLTQDLVPERRARSALSSWINFPVRHWRGEFSLRVAYWLFGFAGSIACLIVLKGITINTAVPQHALGSYIVLLAFLVVVVSIWQVVGVWRSSDRYIRSSGRRNWAGLAKVGMLFSALQLALGAYSILAPIAREHRTVAGIRIAGDYIRLLSERNEIEVTGAISFGAGAAFGQLLAVAPSGTRVRCDIEGGRWDEAAKIANLIRQQGVETYSTINCTGACAVVFLAGSKRYLAKNAQLGLHHNVRPIPGTSSGVDLIGMLKTIDAPSWFLQRAGGASADRPWYPSHDELSAAKIIHGIIPSRDES